MVFTPDIKYDKDKEEKLLSEAQPRPVAKAAPSLWRE